MPRLQGRREEVRRIVCFLTLVLLGCTIPVASQPKEKAVERAKPLKIVCKNGSGHGAAIGRNMVITVNHVGSDALYVELGKRKLALRPVMEYGTPGEVEKVTVLTVGTPVLPFYVIGRGNPYTVDTPRGNLDFRDYIPIAGDSGCPVLNKHGEIVGLVSGVGQKIGVGVLMVQKPIIISVRKVK